MRGEAGRGYLACVEVCRNAWSEHLLHMLFDVLRLVLGQAVAVKRDSIDGVLDRWQPASRGRSKRFLSTRSASIS